MASFFEEKASALGHPVFSAEFAQQLDSEDELNNFRSEFLFPEAPEGSGRKEVIYLCGKCGHDQYYNVLEHCSS